MSPTRVDISLADFGVGLVGVCVWAVKPLFSSISLAVQVLSITSLYIVPFRWIFTLVHHMSISCLDSSLPRGRRGVIVNWLVVWFMIASCHCFYCSFIIILFLC